ncbi:hypothetical protein ABZ816_27170 [Actinosynnema sp. NPDC047251]|uniref:Uncharacterized protein n=1 Tax=Saccharothrix espanaensis (strain ATCC 51144 / DSM 44229 / JCM 9112 / NBRC 15066 / NRRL 15764) TaxID=1179773 RepID=K0JS73_SACES|nr:hypothetical protein [Saccharothrix espanaensis]CCH28681.1 hypothetical protein BN6_13550 [Saccharothrix espanaensis DSM 44229]
MNAAIVVLVLIVVVIGGVWYLAKSRAAARQRALEDAQADARRWVERLGGQVMNLTGTDVASSQALADASERFTAAGSQMEQAKTVEQCKLVTQTAMEGLYYVRAARTAMGIDPGPELPDLTGQSRAGQVSEDRQVSVEGHDYAASPRPGAGTPHYYPGGVVAGRPVPQGWYSEPWWKPALVAGAWGVGSFLLFNAMFSGMAGVAMAGAYSDGYADGAAADGGDGGDGGGGDGGGDVAGGDGGGGDWGGGDFGGGFDF